MVYEHLALLFYRVCILVHMWKVLKKHASLLMIIKHQCWGFVVWLLRAMVSSRFTFCLPEAKGVRFSRRLAAKRSRLRPQHVNDENTPPRSCANKFQPPPPPPPLPPSTMPPPPPPPMPNATSASRLLRPKSTPLRDKNAVVSILVGICSN